MIQHLPAYVSVTFGLTTLVTLLLFYWTIHQSSVESTRQKGPYILVGLIGWLVLQAFLP